MLKLARALVVHEDRPKENGSCRPREGVIHRGAPGSCAQRCPRAQHRDSQGSEANPGLLMGRGWGAPQMRGDRGSWVCLAWRREVQGGVGEMQLLSATTSKGLQRRWSQTVLVSAEEKGQVADCCLREILRTC